MNSSLEWDLKDRVRQGVDIVDLVGGYLELRRQGRGYVAHCPWHDDRRPSLQVNPDRQTWRCWVCNLGGDVFSFVMQREGVTFAEALHMLAERIGISLDQLRGGKKITPGSPDDKATLYKALAWAEERFCRCLADVSEAEVARRYLAERGITLSSCQQFRIGFAPDQWDWLTKQANAAGFSGPVLTAAGLARTRSDGSLYDWFRGRLMFSIRDTQDRPIAFGGRSLPGIGPSDSAKYINSPETRVFSKSRELYGLSLAKSHLQRGERALVMEGYTDVVMAHQQGIKHAVAVLGTALGESHLRVLQRFTDRVTLVLDGDAAGQRRADEIVSLFAGGSLDLRVLTLPDGLDPCEYLQQGNRESFLQMVEAAPDALDHKLARLSAGVDPQRDMHAVSQALETMLGLLARIPSQDGDAASLRVQQMVVRMSRHFGLPLEDIRQRLSALRAKASARPNDSLATQRQPPQPSSVVARLPAQQTQRLFGADRELLEILLAAPELVPQALESIDSAWLASDVAQQLFALYQQLELRGVALDFDQLMLAVDEPAMKAMLVGLDEAARDKLERQREGVSASDRLASLATYYRERIWVDARQQRINELASSQLADQEELDTLKQLFETERLRQQRLAQRIIRP